MPPRKKAKASAASTPLTETQPKTPQDTGAAPDQASPEDRLNDPWTVEQETQLLKSMMRWKPTGLHKHFRIICIHNNMRSLGYAPEDAQHTRIPGLWRKISQWYDLNALDERENSYAFRDYGDPLDADDWDDIPRFTLPEEDYGHLIFPRRVRERGSGGSSSPPFIPVEEDNALYQPGIGLLSDLPDRAKSWRAGSASTTRTNSKTTKSTRAEKTTAKNAKGAKSGPAAVNAKAQSAVSDSAEEDDEEEGDEEEDEDSSESEAEPAPSTRRTNRSGGRAKPAPKRTRKR